MTLTFHSLIPWRPHTHTHKKIQAWDLRRGLEQSVATLSFQPEDVVRTFLWSLVHGRHACMHATQTHTYTRPQRTNGRADLTDFTDKSPPHDQQSTFNNNRASPPCSCTRATRASSSAARAPRRMTSTWRASSSGKVMEGVCLWWTQTLRSVNAQFTHAIHMPYTCTRLHTEWSIHANDQLSGLPFCPLLHRAYEGGGHNRCNLKKAQARACTLLIFIVPVLSTSFYTKSSPTFHNKTINRSRRTGATCCGAPTMGGPTCGTHVSHNNN